MNKLKKLLYFTFIFLTFLNCENNKLVNNENRKLNIEKNVIDKNEFQNQEIEYNDMEKINGNYVVFLRPDDKKFESLKNEDGIYEVDSDFGFAIQNTIDSIDSEFEFKKINNIVSTKRYLKLENCKNCPKTIDRDTILYGIILTAPNKEIEIISGVQALNYLPLIKDYFK